MPVQHFVNPDSREEGGDEGKGAMSRDFVHSTQQRFVKISGKSVRKFLCNPAN